MDLAQAEALNSAIRTIAIKHRTLTAAVFARLGLYPGHEAVLLALRDHGPLTQTRLGARIGCEPSSVTKMVQKLDAAGLVERRHPDHDARALVVALTEPGRDLIPKLEQAWVEIAEAATADLSDRDRQRVTDAVQALAASLHSTRVPNP